MRPVRIGYVKYLNTLPLVEGLKSWVEAELVAAVPSRLCDMLTGGEVDVALVSLIDAARSAVPLTLLPVGMIGSDGRTLTVRLFSRTPFERIVRVGVDTDSHTSSALARVLLAARFGVRPEFVDYDAREYFAAAGSAGQPDALLLIGDKVVTDPPDSALYPHQLDLGQAWREWTGLPFVYAVWMCRAGEEASEPVRAAAEVLERARLHNASRLDWLVSARATERGWTRDAAAEYIGTALRFEVGDAERAAVDRFLTEAAGLGLITSPAVRWAEPG